MPSSTRFNGLLPSLMEFLLFPLLWVVVSFALSLGGWQLLAARYRLVQWPPNVEVSSLEWAKMGWGSYKNVLKAGACREGLVLQVSWLFRLFHPPLLIPWSAVGSIQTTASFWSTTYRIALATGDDTHVGLQFTSLALLTTLQPWVHLMRGSI
jgi:hypothetical protein